MINFRDKFGQVDLTLIDPAAAAEMSDEAQAVLAIVIESVQNSQAAAIRVKKAEEATRDAMRAEADAFAVHQKANPAPSFLEIHRASIASYNGAPDVAKGPEPEPVANDIEAPAPEETPTEEVMVSAETGETDVSPERAPAPPQPAPKKTSHPKHAKLAPRLAYEKACARVADARTELQAAKNYQRHCELVESSALAELIRISPPPSAEQVHRDLVAAEQARKLERIEKGLPAEEPTAPKVVGSPIDQVFADRAKNSHRLSRKRVNHPAIRGPMFRV